MQVGLRADGVHACEFVDGYGSLKAANCAQVLFININDQYCHWDKNHVKYADFSKPL